MIGQPPAVAMRNTSSKTTNTSTPGGTTTTGGGGGGVSRATSVPSQTTSIAGRGGGSGTNRRVVSANASTTSSRGGGGGGRAISYVRPSLVTNARAGAVGRGGGGRVGGRGVRNGANTATGVRGAAGRGVRTINNVGGDVAAGRSSRNVNPIPPSSQQPHQQRGPSLSVVTTNSGNNTNRGGVRGFVGGRNVNAARGPPPPPPVTTNRGRTANVGVGGMYPQPQPAPPRTGGIYPQQRLPPRAGNIMSGMYPQPPPSAPPLSPPSSLKNNATTMTPSHGILPPPPPPSSLHCNKTTKLLTLSIHESSTFKTEIALHPDLFGPSPSSTSTPNPSTTTVINGIDSCPPTPMVSTTSTTKPTTKSLGGENLPPLNINDVIEIKIWDVRPDAVSEDRGGNRRSSVCNTSTVVQPTATTNTAPSSSQPTPIQSKPTSVTATLPSLSKVPPAPPLASASTLPSLSKGAPPAPPLISATTLPSLSKGGPPPIGGNITPQYPTTTTSAAPTPPNSSTAQTTVAKAILKMQQQQSQQQQQVSNPPSPSTATSSIQSGSDTTKIQQQQQQQQPQHLASSFHSSTSSIPTTTAASTTPGGGSGGGISHPSSPSPRTTSLTPTNSTLKTIITPLSTSPAIQPLETPPPPPSIPSTTSTTHGSTLLPPRNPSEISKSSATSSLASSPINAAAATSGGNIIPPPRTVKKSNVSEGGVGGGGGTTTTGGGIMSISSSVTSSPANNSISIPDSSSKNVTTPILGKIHSSSSSTTSNPQQPSISNTTPSSAKNSPGRNALPVGVEATDRAVKERRTSLQNKGSPNGGGGGFWSRTLNKSSANTPTKEAAKPTTIKRNNIVPPPPLPLTKNSSSPPSPSSLPVSALPTTTTTSSPPPPPPPPSLQPERKIDETLRKIQKTRVCRISFVTRVTENTLTSIKSSARVQVSLLRQVADLYNLSAYDAITITKIDDKNDKESTIRRHSADFVTVTIKDQFISRGEMNRFQERFIGKWIYKGQRLNTSDGVRAVAKQIRFGKRQERSGFVTADTKITFRSRSARIIWLVQISSEMWDYASPYESAAGTTTTPVGGGGGGGNGAAGGNVGGGGGYGSSDVYEEDEDGICDIYFDKYVSFLHKLFEKWKELKVTHSLTVVFFSRTYLRSHPGQNSTTGQNSSKASGSVNDSSSTSAVQVDIDGRRYEDHYKIVIENTTTSDWGSLVLKIKRAFIQYPRELGWNTSHENGRAPSIAAQGNLLEAINITLNLLHFHYMDRDLCRTGNSIVVVSPGSGVFEVDKALAGITKQRMMDNGIGSDMLSLGLPPLHIAPFFLYKVDPSKVNSMKNMHDEKHRINYLKTYFEVPHWMNLSFISYESHGTISSIQEEELARTDLNSKEPIQSPKETELQPKSYHVSANGFMVHEPSSTPIYQQKNGQTSTGIQIEKSSDFSSQPGTTDTDNGKAQQRHLISGRDFLDILEACRPRNRGEFVTGLPSALTSILQKCDPNQSASYHSKRRGKRNKGTHSSDGSDKNNSNAPNEPTKFNQMKPYPSTATISEWGTVNFDDFAVGNVRPSKVVSYQTLVDDITSTGQSATPPDHQNSGSDSSSFNSHFSAMLGRSPEFADLSKGSMLGNYFQNSPIGLQLQPSMDQLQPSMDQLQPSLDIEILMQNPQNGEGDTHMARSKSARSDDSLSTLGAEDDYGTEKNIFADKAQHPSPILGGSFAVKNDDATQHATSESSLRNLMMAYDSNVFLPQPKKERSAASVASLTPTSIHTHVESQSRFNHTHRGSDLWGRSSMQSLSSILPPGTSGIGTQVGGIGAALVQFNTKVNAVTTHSEVGNVIRSSSSRRIVGADNISSFTGSYGGSSYNYMFDVAGERHSNRSPSTLGLPVGSDPPDRIRANTPTNPGLLLSLEKKGSQGKDSVGFTRNPVTSVVSRLPPESKASTDAPVRFGGQTTALKSTLDTASERNTSDTVSSAQTRDTKQSPSKKSQHHHGHSYKGKKKKKQSKKGHKLSSQKSSTSHPSRRKAWWVLNPFRQADEEEVLAKRTHNRRRWSHVFPTGEIEFKRHAGPNWKSLCQPAALPITIDFHPSPQELNDRYKFKFYSVSLDAMEHTPYESHAELLSEMVTQRLIQDFQLVPSSVLEQSTSRGEAERKAQHLASTKESVAEKPFPVSLKNQPMSTTPMRIPYLNNENTIQRTLSMGHRIQVLSYNPTSDSVEVVQYYSVDSLNLKETQTYNYMMWCPLKQKYLKVVQTFTKFSREYRWNEVDNLICGDPDKTFSEGTRFRRLGFSIIPDSFSNMAQEQEYVSKFQRLLEYLNKLQQKDLQQKMEIKITTSQDDDKDEGTTTRQGRIGRNNTVRRFVVDLRKGKRDNYEWMEMVLDASFSTKRTFKINFQWLVASASKVDGQIQLLQRRCTQYGLNLVSFPHVSVSADIFLNPFFAPILVPVRDKDTAASLEETISTAFDFVSDGEVFTDPSHLRYIDGFNFPIIPRFFLVRKVLARQFLHRSGVLFLRLIKDEKGWVIFVIFQNRRHIGGDPDKEQLARNIFLKLDQLIAEATRNAH